MRRRAPGTVRHHRSLAAVATLASAGLLLVGCTAAGKAGEDDSASGKGAKDQSVKVGLVYSRTGLLADYGKQYRDGFMAGLDYATKGTGKVAGHRIEVTEQDDAGDPGKAVAAAKNLIGKGYKVLVSTTDSGVALQMAPLAAQNKVLYISGPAATDAVTGINDYTFRSGLQSYQDILTAGAMLGEAKGKKVTVLAQDSTFGQANVAAVKAVLGAKGAKVGSVLAPPSATDLTPFARQVKAGGPDLVFVAWWLHRTGAVDGAGPAGRARGGQGRHGTRRNRLVPGVREQQAQGVVPGALLPGRGRRQRRGEVHARLRHEGRMGTPDLFTPDGFTAAQMVVRAVEEGGATDSAAMVKALEGWSFDGVKGKEQVRAEDHALVQPMFVAKLKGTGPSAVPELVSTEPMDEVAPPVKPSAG